MTSTIQNGEGVETPRIPTRPLCARCQRYIVIDSIATPELWAEVIGERFGPGYICADCFARAADERLIDWKAGLRFEPYSLAAQLAVQGQSLAREPATADVERAERARELLYAHLETATGYLAYDIREIIECKPDALSHVSDGVVTAILNAMLAFADAAPSSEPAIAEGERFINANAERAEDGSVYIWYDAPDGSIAPYILDDEHARDLLVRLTAALAQSSTPPASNGVEVPAGWKLVPVDLTFEPAMREAAWKHIDNKLFHGLEAQLKSLWSAMLAAAPTPSNDALQGRGEVTDATMRAALQDIADAEAIPNDAVAFVWCRDVAIAALQKDTRHDG